MRQKRLPFALALKCVLLGSLLLTYSWNGVNAQTNETDPRQAQLEKLRSVIDQLKNELDSAKDNRSELQKDLEKSESKISDLDKKSKALEKSLQKNQTQLIELQDKKEGLDTAKKQQLRQVNEHLNTAYRLGQQSHLKLLLNQKDASLVARNLKYFDYILAARAENISAANETLQALKVIEPKITQKQQKLKKNRSYLRRQQQALKSEQASRQQTLAKLEKAISNTGQQLKEKQKNQKRLQQLIERVVRVTGSIDAPINNQRITELKGRLPWPTKGKVRHKYNSQRVEGKIRWQGLFIDAPADAPVTAVHHGRVVFSDYLRGHGLLIIVDHGQGLLSLYAHNKTLYKTLGEWVNTGELLASVGNSGGQSQTGLYFELRKNGTPTNPDRWLKRSA